MRSLALNRSQMRLRVLVLSRNYPNNVVPTLGLWVEGLVRAMRAFCDPLVVSPVPYCPPLPAFVEYARFRRIWQYESRNDVEVWHPRFVVGLGYTLHNLEALTYEFGIQRVVDRLHRERGFDLIHAVFSYPDGVAAARLGRRYGVPVIITEHAAWRPWMDKYPRVRRQAVWASSESAFHIAPSRFARDLIAQFTGESSKLRVIPNGVDGDLFMPLPEGAKPDPNQIVFVGFINYVKGVDILLQAMRLVVIRRPQTRLVLVGGGFYRNKRLQGERLQRLAAELGLESAVTFAGIQPPSVVARTMRESSLLVLPSQRETFGAVLVEALACGIPVIATRCGGPEDIVNDDVGVLVPIGDPSALAAAIDDMLENRARYDKARLRAYALEKFSWAHLAQQTVDLYEQAVSPDGRGGAEQT